MADISPQGNAATTAERNLIYSGPPDPRERPPLNLDELVLTGKDGVGKPIEEHLTGRVTAADVSLTVEGASTITIGFADSDRGVLRSPVLSTGLPSVSSVASALLNDVNTLPFVAPDGSPIAVGGSTYSQQVPGGKSQAAAREANKNLVVQIGVNRKLPRAAVVIAMMTMLDESGGVNVLTPDSNGSYGIMQQTPTQGWGTVAQVTDPVYAINTFYDRLLAESGWANMSPWVAAQRVQRSAWTGNPNKNNGYSSEVGGNYHLKYNEALQAVQAYRPDVSTTTAAAAALGSAGIVTMPRAASAAITYRGRDWRLVNMTTKGASTSLVFEDALINQLRQNVTPYSSSEPTTMPRFVAAVLAQDGFDTSHVAMDEVVSRIDPTGALNAGESDPATLANFDQLLATDGVRGDGTLATYSKFASVQAQDPNAPSGAVISTNGVVQSSWVTITGLTAPLNWLAMSDGTAFYIGPEEFVAQQLARPPIVVRENQDGVGWISGDFDLGKRTSNALTFTTTAPFEGVEGQVVVVPDLGLLTGIWQVHTIAYSAFSVQTTVTCQRITADLQDAEHQAASDALLVGGGGVTTTNSGVLAGSRPQILGQVSGNGWAAGDAKRADIASFTVPGTAVRVQLNQECAPLLLWVAQQFNTSVERLDASQCGGYDYRKNVNNLTVWSNHASGTAIDLNSTIHPNRAPTSSSFSPARIAAVRAIVKATNGAVRWGGDYHSDVDSMHFEINTDSPGVQHAISALGLAGGIVGYGRTTGPH